MLETMAFAALASWFAVVLIHGFYRAMREPMPPTKAGKSITSPP